MSPTPRRKSSTSMVYYTRSPMASEILTSRSHSAGFLGGRGRKLGACAPAVSVHVETVVGRLLREHVSNYFSWYSLKFQPIPQVSIILPKYCHCIAKILPTHCQNLTKTLPKHCQNIANALPFVSYLFPIVPPARKQQPLFPRMSTVWYLKPTASLQTPTITSKIEYVMVFEAYHLITYKIEYGVLFVAHRLIK